MVIMTWWTALANSIAHGEPPLSAARIVVWQCEECGGCLFQVLAWDAWDEIDERDIFTKYNRFALKCLDCGRVEADMTVSKCLW